MSTTVTYKGETLTTVNNATKTLETKGTWLEDDLTLVDVSGGGSTLITKSISANGTYNASSDSADGYLQVTVAVPNSYSAGDEGKVVDSGALVAQTAHADVTPTTSDQTIDTTTNNSIKVKGDANLVAGNKNLKSSAGEVEAIINVYTVVHTGFFIVCLNIDTVVILLIIQIEKHHCLYSSEGVS